VSAYARFGKSHHTAGLDFGDCLTYAVAHLAGQPLLRVGTDFSETDVEICGVRAGTRPARGAVAWWPRGAGNGRGPWAWS